MQKCNLGGKRKGRQPSASQRSIGQTTLGRTKQPADSQRRSDRARRCSRRTRGPPSASLLSSKSPSSPRRRSSEEGEEEAEKKKKRRLRRGRRSFKEFYSNVSSSSTSQWVLECFQLHYQTLRTNRLVTEAKVSTFNGTLSSDVSRKVEKTGQSLKVQSSNSLPVRLKREFCCFSLLEKQNDEQSSHSKAKLQPRCMLGSWNWTYRQVSGWIQEDDQQRGRQAVAGLGAVGFDADQCLWLEREHSRRFRDLSWGAAAPTGSDRRVLAWSSLSGVARGVNQSSRRWSFPCGTSSNENH